MAEGKSQASTRLYSIRRWKELKKDFPWNLIHVETRFSPIEFLFIHFSPSIRLEWHRTIRSKRNVSFLNKIQYRQNVEKSEYEERNALNLLHVYKNSENYWRKVDVHFLRLALYIRWDSTKSSGEFGFAYCHLIHLLFQSIFLQFCRNATRKHCDVTNSTLSIKGIEAKSCIISAFFFISYLLVRATRVVRKKCYCYGLSRWNVTRSFYLLAADRSKSTSRSRSLIKFRSYISSASCHLRFFTWNLFTFLARNSFRNSIISSLTPWLLLTCACYFHFVFKLKRRVL